MRYTPRLAATGSELCRTCPKMLKESYNAFKKSTALVIKLKMHHRELLLAARLRFRGIVFLMQAMDIAECSGMFLLKT